jgi:hypothetical protein
MRYPDGFGVEETTGPEEDVVVATTEHGRRLHNMTPTRDEVLAMAGAASDGQESLTT